MNDEPAAQHSAFSLIKGYVDRADSLLTVAVRAAETSIAREALSNAVGICDLIVGVLPSVRGTAEERQILEASLRCLQERLEEIHQGTLAKTAPSGGRR